MTIEEFVDIFRKEPHTENIAFTEAKIVKQALRQGSTWKSVDASFTKSCAYQKILCPAFAQP